MSALELYKQKLVSADAAPSFLRDGDTVIVPTGAAEPPDLLTALSEQRLQFRDIKVHQILAMRRYGYLDPETVAHVRHVALFYGGATRAGGQQGWVDFIPNYFSEIPAQIRRGLIAADVVFSLASPMDDEGYFSLSLGTDYTMAAIERARVVVLEVNPHVPFAHGNCRVHISQVAAVVESETPIIEVGLPAIGPVQAAIGKYVADMIDDGSTLQIGFGGIPDAVVMQLVNKRDLGIHTEMIGDGILSLVECGAVNCQRKNYQPGKIIATFALGSRKLYQFMHRNPMLEMHPVDFTNDPSLAGQNDKLVSINATLQIDLLGQCGSESLGSLPFGPLGAGARCPRPSRHPCQRGAPVWA